TAWPYPALPPPGNGCRSTSARGKSLASGRRWSTAMRLVFAYISLRADMKLELRYLAHSRSGDKGNIFNVGIFAYEPAAFPYLVEQLTEDVVKDFYQVARKVDRYVAENISGMNFVMHDALAGGVSRTL